MRFQGLIPALRTITLPLRSHSVRALQRPPLPIPSATVLKAGPTIPFLGALFGSSAKSDSQSNNMSYPDQRSDDAWQAVLSPGMYAFILIFYIVAPHLLHGASFLLV